MTSPTGPPAGDNPLSLVHAQLCDALDALPGVTVMRRPAGSSGVAPPAVWVQPPAVTWGAYSSHGEIVTGPTEGTCDIYLIVKRDDQTLARLFTLLPEAVRLIESSEADASVVGAEPAEFDTGTTRLPCYVIRTEIVI